MNKSPLYIQPADEDYRKKIVHARGEIPEQRYILQKIGKIVFFCKIEKKTKVIFIYADNNNRGCWKQKFSNTPLTREVLYETQWARRNKAVLCG